MNIVFAADSDYIPHLAVAIWSLLASNSKLAFNIYVINSDITQDQWDALTGLDHDRKHNFIDAKVSDAELAHVVVTNWFSKTTYYKLFIPDVVPYDKALYFDSDVIFRGPIDELWSIDIADVFLAAVEDGPVFTRATELEMSPSSTYFNAGMMVLNLEMCRRESLKSRVIDFVERKPTAIKWVDQCGLNSIIDGRWRKLHPKFNMQTYFYKIVRGKAATEMNFNEVLEAVSDPTIVHFTEQPKPLDLACSHPYKHEYWRHLKKTSFSRRFQRNISVASALRRYFPRLVWLLDNFVMISKEQGLAVAISRSVCIVRSSIYRM